MIATALNGRQLYNATVTWNRIEAGNLWDLQKQEIAQALGIDRTTLWRHIKLLVETFDQEWEPVTAPLARVAKRVYRIAKESILGVLIASRYYFESIFIAFLKDSLRPPEDLVILERDLKVVPKNPLSNDKESLGDSCRPPAETEPLCVAHFCRDAKTYIHINRKVESCSVCGLTFDAALELISDPVESVKVCAEGVKLKIQEKDNKLDV